MKIILAFLVILIILCQVTSIGLTSNYQLLLNLAKKHKLHKLENTPESSNNSKSEKTEKINEEKNNEKKEDVKPSDNKVFNNLNEKKQLTQDELKKEDLKDTPIFYQGWLKYFKFMDGNKTEKPKHFFKNADFEKQSEIKEESDKVRIFNKEWQVKYSIRETFLWYFI